MIGSLISLQKRALTTPLFVSIIPTSHHTKSTHHRKHHLMTNTARPNILFAFSRQVWDGFVDPAELARLETFADWEWLPCEGGGRTYFRAHEDPAGSDALRAKISDADALIVCHGAPYVDATIMDAAPNLHLIGELEGGPLCRAHRPRRGVGPGHPHRRRDQWLVVPGL